MRVIVLESYVGKPAEELIGALREAGGSHEVAALVYDQQIFAAVTPPQSIQEALVKKMQRRLLEKPSLLDDLQENLQQVEQQEDGDERASA